MRSVFKEILVLIQLMRALWLLFLFPNDTMGTAFNEIEMHSWFSFN